MIYRCSCGFDGTSYLVLNRAESDGRQPAAAGNPSEMCQLIVQIGHQIYSRHCTTAIYVAEPILASPCECLRQTRERNALKDMAWEKHYKRGIFGTLQTGTM